MGTEMGDKGSQQAQRKLQKGWERKQSDSLGIKEVMEIRDSQGQETKRKQKRT